MQFLQPPGWATPKGYANGIAAKGTLVFLCRVPFTEWFGQLYVYDIQGI